MKFLNFSSTAHFCKTFSCHHLLLSLSAQSEIVTNLIPNLSALESHLDDFCRICDADEVVLFERATFLVISQGHAQKGYSSSASSSNAPPMSTSTQQQLTRSSASSAKSPQFDAHRFEKISNIVKQFKLSCGKTQSQFAAMEVRNSKFSAFIDAFTANTYIMVIVSDPSIHTATTLLNIKNAKSHFERFIPRS